MICNTHNLPPSTAFLEKMNTAGIESLFPATLRLCDHGAVRNGCGALGAGYDKVVRTNFRYVLWISFITRRRFHRRLDDFTLIRWPSKRRAEVIVRVNTLEINTVSPRVRLGPPMIKSLERLFVGIATLAHHTCG